MKGEVRVSVITDEAGKEPLTALKASVAFDSADVSGGPTDPAQAAQRIAGALRDAAMKKALATEAETPRD